MKYLFIYNTNTFEQILKTDVSFCMIEPICIISKIL